MPDRAFDNLSKMFQHQQNPKNNTDYAVWLLSTIILTDPLCLIQEFVALNKPQEERSYIWYNYDETAIKKLFSNLAFKSDTKI